MRKHIGIGLNIQKEYPYWFRKINISLSVSARTDFFLFLSILVLVWSNQTILVFYSDHIGIGQKLLWGVTWCVRNCRPARCWDCWWRCRGPNYPQNCTVIANTIIVLQGVYEWRWRSIWFVSKLDQQYIRKNWMQKQGRKPLPQSARWSGLGSNWRPT